jgi:hypothetical protein
MLVESQKSFFFAFIQLEQVNEKERKKKWKTTEAKKSENRLTNNNSEIYAAKMSRNKL